MRSVVMLDNLDSFTFNLVDALRRLGREVSVLRNTASAQTVITRAQKSHAAIVVSPGPGTPQDAGCLLDVVAQAKGTVPLLGICLGHQAILVDAGAHLSRLDPPVHGRPSVLGHDGTGLFEGLPSPVSVGRYHSLGVTDVPRAYHVHARVDGIAMAISSRAHRQVGLQFHPESILTPRGDAILTGALHSLEAGSC
jgi:anthranilate synthase component II